MSHSVIDGATNTVVHTRKVGTHPEAVTVDPSSHTVYVANDDDNDVSVIDQGPDGPRPQRVR